MTLYNTVSVYSQSQRENLLNSLGKNNETEFFPILEAVDWTPEAIGSFKDSVLSKPQLHICHSDVVSTLKVCVHVYALVGHLLGGYITRHFIDLGGTYIWPGEYTQIRVSI